MSRDGASYVGFELGCVWDVEHGACDMIHRRRVAAIGQADVSFFAWIASQDAQQAGGTT